jgi:hypothetical protein
MLVSRAALDRVNDIERIRGELIDDVGFCRNKKFLAFLPTRRG